MLDRTLAPLSLPVKSVNIIKAESLLLPNGVPVHVIRVDNQPVFKIEIVLKASKWNEPQNGVASFAIKMLSEGTLKKRASQIADYVDGLGGFLEINPGLDYSSISIYALSKHFNLMVYLLSELMYESVFPVAELDNMKNIKIQSLKVDDEKSNMVASRAFRENLFGKHHPYGQDLKASDVEKVDRPLIHYYHQSRMVSDFEIILSGDVPSDLKDLENAFNRKSSEKALPPIHIMPEPNKGLIVIEKKEALQSSIRIGCRLFAKRHPDYLPMLVVNEILGGYFGSRLMKNIREEKGYTYGISSNIANMKHMGYFVIGTDVKREFTKSTLDEIYKEIDILKNQPVSADELETVKNYMAGSLLASINTPFALADKFKSIHFHGLSYKFYQDYLETLNTITSTQIQDLTNKYLRKENMVEVVVGGL